MTLNQCMKTLFTILLHYHCLAGGTEAQERKPRCESPGPIQVYTTYFNKQAKCMQEMSVLEAGALVQAWVIKPDN